MKYQTQKRKKIEFMEILLELIESMNEWMMKIESQAGMFVNWN